jgi:magnesium chelatase family protein
MPNARLSGRHAEVHARIGGEGRSMLQEAVANLHLSARAHHRVLKVARTIADLEGRSDVATDHLLEALRYRQT